MYNNFTEILLRKLEGNLDIQLKGIEVREHKLIAAMEQYVIGGLGQQ